MLTCLALAVATLQTINPVLPEGAHPEFQRAAMAVGKALSSSDFDSASKLAELLPKASIVVGWADAGLAPDQQTNYRALLDKAMTDWQRSVPTVHMTVGDHPDIRFHFVSGKAGGAELTFGSSPRIDVAIPLQRGTPAIAVSDADMQNELMHVFAVYFGVAENPYTGSSTHAFTKPTIRYFGVIPTEYIVAQRLLRLSESLRTAIVNKQKVVLVQGQAELEPAALELGTVHQGDHVPILLKLRNHGAGPLRYRLVPDCGCFSRTAPGEIKPGDGADIRLTMDTTEFMGDLHKALVLFTNDPVLPARDVLVHVKIVPAYRFLRPGGDSVVVPDGGGTFDVFLTFPQGADLHPNLAQIDGLTGTVDVQPWAGSLADPDLGEGPLPRKGYRVRIRLDDRIPPGQATATISIATESETFPVLRYNLTAQKGIVALPERVYFGAMGSTSRTEPFLISRPGKPFKVVSVKTQSRNLTATAVRLPKGDEYKVEVVYDGKAPAGDFLADVAITTDDPKAGVIHVPVTGTVTR